MQPTNDSNARSAPGLGQLAVLAPPAADAEADALQREEAEDRAQGLDENHLIDLLLEREARREQLAMEQVSSGGTYKASIATIEASFGVPGLNRHLGDTGGKKAAVAGDRAGTGGPVASNLQTEDSSEEESAPPPPAPPGALRVLPTSTTRLGIDGNKRGATTGIGTEEAGPRRGDVLRSTIPTDAFEPELEVPRSQVPITGELPLADLDLGGLSIRAGGSPVDAQSQQRSAYTAIHAASHSGSFVYGQMHGASRLRFLLRRVLDAPLLLLLDASPESHEMSR